MDCEVLSVARKFEDLPPGTKIEYIPNRQHDKFKYLCEVLPPDTPHEDEFGEPANVYSKGAKRYFRVLPEEDFTVVD